MASAQSSSSETLPLDKHLTCSICMDLFVDPVTTACGHSFCKGCLDRSFNCNDRICPLCKQHQSKIPEVNITLRSIVEEMNKTLVEDDEKFTGAPGEVPCDICVERKLKAKKSCLVCLASYCSTHLENHSSTQRLKGHKLVEPVDNLDERACLKHGRPLELYSRKKERCICVRCMEEDQEEVVSTEDEWGKKKAKLENTKEELQEKIEKRKARVDEIDRLLTICKEQLESEWWDIDDVFTAVLAIVEEAHAAAQKPLKDRREALEKEAKHINTKLEAEINRLEKAISELDDISALEDHILFLQSYPSLQDLDSIKDSTDLEFDTSLTFGTMRKTTTAMMERIQQDLEKLTAIELQRVPEFTVDVKLDPTTAHRHLVLSDDGKEVKDGGEDQEVDETPERFDLFASILGLNRLTSGKSYWEVDVSDKTGWDLGVARGDANRTGKLLLNTKNGYWVTVHYEGDKYAALTVPPVCLSLKDKPKKVGVFVDYEEGLVSFYDMTAESHIYSFTECSFGDELLPYFSPHVKQDEKNSDPLIISAVTHREQDVICREECASLCSAELDLHFILFHVQVNKSVRERPPIPPKVKVPPTFPAPAVRPKEQRREVQTLSQANSANSAAAEGTAKKDPKPLCEAAQPGFYTGMKVKELTQMFSGTTTQGTAVRPKKKQGEEQKVLQELSEAVKAKVTAVQPKEKDKEDPQNKADSTNANTQMNSASAETTTAEDHDTDFSGLKVKELALMFSAATTKETAVRPKMKHREEQKPSQVPDRTRADIKHKIQMREQNVTQGNSSVKAPESLQGSLDAEWLEINSVLSEVVRAAEDAQEKFLYLSLYSLRTTTTTMMEQIHQKMEKISSIELKWISKFAVDVRLDPSTAHRCFVSADGKKVSGTEVKPDAHGRFGDVLGLNRLSSGKSYWEVVVSSRSGWNLGVVRGDVNHKGKLLLNPGNGYWVTEYHDNKYAALTAPPVRLSLKAKPQKVGVFVDYEEGLVSFYDVPARSHIYSFTECRFTGEIYPYFSLYPKENGESADPLIISAVKYL
ncbi:uncharacterized protein LOC121962440 [Plectropomus leopardus]|uniref:uncharacterized protein LOC121962440 n=1 Tax=Plectropomus leopardus TaxID=160734 RepID=UPI001C4AE0A9|nr:uncharacterized protein LOC121962440 [Plectropomus leopardus]